MKTNLTFNYYCLVLFGLVATTRSVGASDFTIMSSELDSKITDITDRTKPRRIGKAPLTLKNLDVGNGKVFLVEKPGFSSVYIPLTSELQKTTAVNVLMHKDTDWTPEDLTQKIVTTAESILDRVLAIQALLDLRKISEALPLAENLKTSYPTSISARLIYANALLLSGDHARADSLYAALLEEIPVSRKPLRDSIEKLRGQLNGRLPASAPDSNPTTRKR